MGQQLPFTFCWITTFLLILELGPDLSGQREDHTVLDESNARNIVDLRQQLTAREREELTSNQRYEEWKRMVRNSMNEKFVTIQHKQLPTKSDNGINEKAVDAMQNLQHMPQVEESAESIPDMATRLSFMPDQLQSLSNRSKAYLVLANHHITESFLPFVGKEYASLLAYLIPYVLLLLPLAFTMCYFGRIRAIFSLQRLLFAVNVYLGGYFAAFMISCFILKAEPMAFFQENLTPSSFTFLLLIQSMSYLLYLLLEMVDLAANCAAGASSITKPSAFTHFTMATMVGFHYHLTVFQRGIAGETPEISWRIYGIYSIAFIMMCVMARPPRGKKEFARIGRVLGDKKH